VINPEEKYFLSSFRMDKDTPGKLGLQFDERKKCYLDSRKLEWKKAFIWESGWSEENGFVRLPELGFDELWTLLIESSIEDNQLGSAEFLDRKYPMELKDKLTDLFNQQSRINRDLSVRLSRLEILKNGMNRNEVIGKPITEIEKYFQEWTNLKMTFDRKKTSRIWDKL
jgi:hypothetical protein